MSLTKGRHVGFINYKDGIPDGLTKRYFNNYLYNYKYKDGIPDGLTKRYFNNYLYNARIYYK